MSKTYTIAAVTALVLAGGAFFMTRGTDALPGITLAANAQTGATEEQIAMVPDMVLGSMDAPITMIEYASFTCPHCANFHATTFEKLKTDYIDTGKVKFIYREVYFDRFGLWAGMVARCGGEARYFGISDLLYTEQKTWIGDGDPAMIGENLKKIGLKAGIGPEAMDACMNDSKMAEAMVAVFQKNAGADAIDSTPSFVVDGQKYSNMGYDEMKTMLDAKLGQ